MFLGCVSGPPIVGGCKFHTLISLRDSRRAKHVTSCHLTERLPVITWRGYDLKNGSVACDRIIPHSSMGTRGLRPSFHSHVVQAQTNNNILALQSLTAQCGDPLRQQEGGERSQGRGEGTNRDHAARETLGSRGKAGAPVQVICAVREGLRCRRVRIKCAHVMFGQIVGHGVHILRCLSSEVEAQKGLGVRAACTCCVRKDFAYALLTPRLVAERTLPKRSSHPPTRAGMPDIPLQLPRRYARAHTQAT